MKNFMHHFFAFGFVASGAIGGMAFYKAVMECEPILASIATIVVIVNMLSNAHHWRDR